MIDKQLIKHKIKDLKTYLKEIKPLIEIEPAKIIRQYRNLRALERDFQLIVDTMLEINTHIIAQSKFKAAEDYQSTFEILGENKILPMDFALKIAPVVGLRNKVVHKYGRVNLKQLIEDIKKGLGDFEKFIQLINKYIKQIN